MLQMQINQRSFVDSKLLASPQNQGSSSSVAEALREALRRSPPMSLEEMTQSMPLVRHVESISMRGAAKQFCESGEVAGPQGGQKIEPAFSR